jgi:hypothetical protein
MQGRELGPEITSLLLHISSLRLMWHLAVTAAAGTEAAPDAAAAPDTAALNTYVQQRGVFAKVLEGLLDSGATEQLVTPEQLLSQQWWNSNSTRAGSQIVGSQGNSGQVPAELAEQLSVGLHTLQDLAFQLLTDLMFLENANASAAVQQQQQGRRAAAGGGFGQMGFSNSVLERVWRYCVGVLGREAPEVPAAGEGGEEEEEEDQIEDDVFDEYVAEGGVAVWLCLFLSSVWVWMGGCGWWGGQGGSVTWRLLPMQLLAAFAVSALS